VERDKNLCFCGRAEARTDIPNDFSWNMTSKKKIRLYTLTAVLKTFTRRLGVHFLLQTCTFISKISIVYLQASSSHV